MSNTNEFMNAHLGLKFPHASWIKVLAVSVCAVIIFLILSKIPVSIDYHLFYMNPTLAWLEQKSVLYDAQADGFYYLPWALLITIPLSFLPEWIGQAFLNLVSLVSIAWVCYLLAGKLKAWQWLIVFVNLFTINLLFTAQWDGLALLGIGLAWWSLQKRDAWIFGMGLMLAATKPVNMILPMFLLCWYALQFLEVKKLIQVLLAPVLLFAWSIWACGIDWPLRYLKYIFTDSPPEAYNNSLWKELRPGPILAIVLIGLSAFIILWTIRFIKKNQHREAILFALVANLIVSPYVMTYHFIVTSPALAWISKRSVILGLAIYGSMLWILLGVARLLPLPVFILYPIFISGGLVALTARSELEIS